MRLLGTAIAATLFASSAAAQHASTPTPVGKPVKELWSGSMEISASPRLGKPLPRFSDEVLRDESEGEVNVSIQRDEVLGNYPLKAKFGLTGSPQVLDDQDATSAYYGEITFGDTYRPLYELELEKGGGRAPDVEDAYRFYARYRFTSAHKGSFDTWLRDEHQLTAGIRYRDVRTIMCSTVMGPARDEGACSNLSGIYLEWRAEVSQIFSTDVTKRRIAPNVRGDIYSPRFLGGIRFFGRAQLEASFYSELRTPAGALREDWRLRATSGFDLSALASRLGPGINFELAGQYQRRWSNDPGSRHERLYFAPSISLKVGF